MALVVVITCARCGAKKEVHVHSWDLHNVTHDCRDNQWEISYRPPRRVF